MLLRLPDVVNTQHLNCRTARAATLDVQVKPGHQRTVFCVLFWLVYVNVPWKSNRAMEKGSLVV